MTSNCRDVFLIRIPAPIDKKSLDGGIIDLSVNTAMNVAKNAITDGTEPQLNYVYEVDRNQSQENLNLVKLNKTSETELKAENTSHFCGYIQFRVKRNIDSDSAKFQPLTKRHVVEPIDHFIKSPIKDKPQLTKKKRRRYQ